LELHAIEHGGRYPSKLADLYPRYIKSLGVFAPPGKENTLRFKDEIDEKGMFVYREIKNIDKLKDEDVIIYQKDTVHPDGFFVLLRSGKIGFMPQELYEKTVQSVKGSAVEIIE